MDRARRAKMTKDDIIKTAFRVWGGELYQNTSLTQLARELGVSKPALYRHFKNKQALRDAMYTSFFDDYAAAIKAVYDRALGADNKTEGLFIVMRAIVAYYVQKPEAFIFSLAQVYGGRELENMSAQMLSRGIMLGHFLNGDSGAYPPKIQLIIASLTFWVAHFHRFEHDLNEAPSEAMVAGVISAVEEKISQGLSRGLGFKREAVEALDFEGLESLIPPAEGGDDDTERLLKAVASVVAEVGPWNASMDMVARRSGLSKSGLYAHFKSKQDMLRQMFLSVLDRIVAYAKAGVRLSAVPEEQLYLAIIFTMDYLCAHPEVLVAVDWLRTRRIDLGIAAAPDLSRLFGDIDGGALPEPTSGWILFLMVNALMRRPAGRDFSSLPRECCRILYKFIVLGAKGYDL
jgi:AcrR family transcriptional regulator